MPRNLHFEGSLLCFPCVSPQKGRLFGVQVEFRAKKGFIPHASNKSCPREGLSFMCSFGIRIEGCGVRDSKAQGFLAWS